MCDTFWSSFLTGAGALELTALLILVSSLSTQRWPPGRQIPALPVPLPLGGEQRLGFGAHCGPLPLPS